MENKRMKELTNKIDSRTEKRKTIENTYDVNLKPGHAVAFDFDGVIHKYRRGWHDGTIYDEFNREMLDLILILMNLSVPVFILSTRSPRQILAWWNAQGFSMEAGIISPSIDFWNNPNIVGITRTKLPAQLYIDDRAYKYEGQTAKEVLISLSKEVNHE